MMIKFAIDYEPLSFKQHPRRDLIHLNSTRNHEGNIY